MPKIRVLVVEDFADRAQAAGARSSAPIPTSRWSARPRTASSAIELCQQLRPDVITMDMMLPVMSGLAATEYIMAHCPTPILIVSASINRGELFKTYEALAAGAVDVLEKPSGDEPDGVWERRFLADGEAGLAHPRHHASARAAGGLAAHAPAELAARRRADPGLRAECERRRHRRIDRRPRRDRRDPARPARGLPAADPARRCTSASRSAPRSPTGSTGRPARRVAYARDGDAGRRGGRPRRAWRRRPAPRRARRPPAPDRRSRAAFLPAVGRRAVRVDRRGIRRRPPRPAC